MGYNAFVVVMTDSLHEIEDDLDFGKKLSQAISHMSVVEKGKTIDISSGNSVNAATVLGVHHADGMHLYSLGGNSGTDHGWCGAYDSNTVNQLKVLANRLGYNLHRKVKKGK